MFKKNRKHLQSSFFDTESMLGETQKKAFHESREGHFYELIFKRIDESIFEPLYSDTMSRPNAPINSMVSALILQNQGRWSYSFLIRQVRFDLLTRMAIGLTNLDEVPFCEATLFNFQKKLLEHEVSTGINLIESIFDGLTKEQLETLKIKTDIQRCDSLQIQSNIRTYSQIQVLVEILLRVYRAFSDNDKARYAELFTAYVGKTSGQYVYAVEPGTFVTELEKLATVYGALHDTILSTYAQTDIARIFTRVFNDHFTNVDGKLSVRPTKELGSGILQSPDDEDATYRKKRGVKYRGHILTATETCNPDNEVQLITDVHVTANNRDDSDELHDRLDGIKAKTPEIAVLHTDGGYGSAKNDTKMKTLEIQQVQTAIRGRTSAVAFTITTGKDGSYSVSCPQQSGEIRTTRTQWKAMMNASVCALCPMRDICTATVRKSGRVLYFDSQDALRHARHRNIRLIPVPMRMLRANVEATMREFSRRLENGKLKVRGGAKARLFGYFAAIGINYGRIYRHTMEKLRKPVPLCA